jgi:tRNA G18 (ribose-2'-O)-methylase SpoU
MKSSTLILVLDNIRSTHNVGSLFRTADCAGVSEIVLCGITPSPIDRFGRPRPDITKVALGAELSVPYHTTDSTDEYLAQQKSLGSTICALEQSATALCLFDESLKKSLANSSSVVLVLGTEVTGIAESTLQLCDYVLEIPQVGTKESLNVSVAGAIAIYHLARINGRLSTI